MKKLILYIPLIFFAGLTFAQDYPEQKVEDQPRRIELNQEENSREPETRNTKDTKPQLSNRKFSWERAVVGGNLGLNFSRDFINVDLAPTFGYFVTDKFLVGAGIIYNFLYLNDFLVSISPPVTLDWKTHSYGGRAYMEYFVYRGLFAHTEFSLINIEGDEVFFVDPNTFEATLVSSRRINVPGLLLGGGYYQQFGGFSGMYIMILYDVLESSDTPYNNPVIRIGFNIALGGRN